jgi:hypothetical protein
MSTKGVGTTVDLITIPVSCKSIDSNQNVTSFSPQSSSNNNQERRKKETNFDNERY